jgi:hypothetical protein
MGTSTDRTKKRLKVTVKAKHIKDGMAQNCQSCPIALAMREQHDPSATMGVTVATINDVNYAAPRSAVSFVDKFDLAHELGKKAKVRPFTFYLTRKVEL